MSLHVPPALIKSGGPFAARYVGGSTGTSFTVDIGKAKSKRIVVVFAASNAPTGSSPSGNTPSVTINGIQAPLAVSQGGNSNRNSFMYYAVIPTGTTANIVVSNANSWNVFSAYVVENYKSPTPIIAQTGGGFTTHQVSINHPSQGFLMAFKNGYGMGGQISIDGVTPPSDQVNNFSSYYGAECASMLIPDTATTDVSSVVTALQAMSLIAAVWR